ncbi:MAG: serine hydrolase domain-containing protein [Candidatus Heimdallarchaeota archaeon]
MKRNASIITTLSMLLVICSFSFVNIKNSSSIIVNSPDYWPTTGWLTSAPEEENMNPLYLENMLQYIIDEEYNVDSILLIRNGYNVFERYFNGWNDSAFHSIFSITKSVMSCLYGIAIEEGLVHLNDTLTSFFTNRTIANLDSAKQNITIEHLLTMSSGIDWNELFSVIQFTNSEDPIQFVLDRTMDAFPGEEFNYNSGAVHLLSAILQNVTGTTTKAYADEKLFTPLGISNYNWDKDPQGIYYGGHGLSLTSPDMAKFGFLYLNNGTWDSDQIVPEEWISVSISKYNYSVLSEDYGYLWWLYPDYDNFCAQGFMGQRIFVFQKYNFIAVITSPEYSTVYLVPILISDFLLPSLNEYPYTPPTTPTAATSLLIGVIPVLCLITIFTKYYTRRKYE